LITTSPAMSRAKFLPGPPSGQLRNNLGPTPLAAESKGSLLETPGTGHDGTYVMLEDGKTGSNRSTSQLVGLSALGSKSQKRAAPRRRMKSGKRGGSAPRLPPTIEVVLCVPSRIRYILGSTVTYTAVANITRGALICSFGVIGYGTNDVAAWASSFRLSRITAWPSAGGDFGLLSADSGSAEQALVKDSEKISTIPTGITTTETGRVFKFPKRTYLGMWQSAVNPTDVLLTYWGTAGTVVDVEGAFTLAGAGGAGSPFGEAVASASAGQVYYLSPDGNTTHNWVPQGLPTTH